MKNNLMRAKTVKESTVEATYMVLPEHTNALGSVFGGTIMSWIDMTAAITAFKHCRQRVVTASMDELHFLNPLKLGDLVTLNSSVNGVGRTSLEIGVKVTAQDPITGQGTHTATAYLTFVAVSASGIPSQVPPLKLKGAQELRRAKDAQNRKLHRLKSKQRLLQQK